MTTYYADFDLATGAETGADWANAWRTLQDAIDGKNGTPPTAGDTVECCGTDTTTVTVDIDQGAGSEAAGFLKFVGVNSSTHLNDGSKAVIDANGGNFNVVAPNTVDFVWMENFDFTGSGNADGVDVGSGCVGWVFLNCSTYSNGNRGFDCYGMSRSFFILCSAYNNTGHGFMAESYCLFLFCTSRDNLTGFYGAYGASTTYIVCLAYSNSDDGFRDITTASIMFNCVIDNNADNGVQVNSATAYINALIGCRVTQHDDSGDIGVNANSELLVHGWNYFEDNDGANIQNATVSQEILDNGVSTDLEDQSDTGFGYTGSVGSEDYDLRSDATLRRTAVALRDVS